MELISVIVPVYNVEDYLERCIDSITGQTYKNLEIILVDDGSTDNSGEICDRKAEEDDRIIVIHKQNGGLSDARNTGLAAASGEYISFIDSDDRIEKKMYMTLFNAIKENNCGASGCKFFRTDNINADFPEADDSVKIYSGAEIQHELINDKIIQQVVWNKLYRTELIKDIPFEFGKCNEDEFWTYKALDNCNTFAAVNYYGYAYLQRSQSIINSSFSLKRLDAVEGKALRAEYIKTHYPELYNEAVKNLISTCIYSGQLSLMNLSGNDIAKASEILKGYTKKYSLPFSYLTKLKLTEFVWLFIAKINLSFCCKIKNLLKIGL